MQDSPAFRWPDGARAAVSFTFDDARASQLDEAVPLLLDHGMPATFYVSLERVSKAARAWRDVAATGLFELGNHSLKHACSANFLWGRPEVLEDYTLERMERELREASARILDLTGVDPVTFAYPCGQDFVGRGLQRRSYAPIVADLFLAGRGFRDEYLNHPGLCDLVRLGGTELDGCSFREARAVLDRAAATGQWVVFVGHEVARGNRQTVRRDVLEALCHYCFDPANGLWPGTVADIAERVRRHRQQAAAAGEGPQGGAR